MIDQSGQTLTVFYQGWHDYQTLLIKALTPLSPDQLALRASPGLRSIGETATHMIGARARWLQDLVSEGGEDLAALGAWDREGMPTRSAAELVTGLETTWRVIEHALARWSPTDWEQTFEGEPGDLPTYTRRWVVWHLIEHDVHHGGEISLTLGMHALTAPDL
jgi:uncharacterized damage-inducible protein DinB